MAESLLETSAETMSPKIVQGQDEVAEEVHAFMGSLRPFWGRALLYIVLLFIGIAIIWAWWSEVDLVTSAPFQLVPMGQVKTMQARRGGEIELIGVKEGDHIEKGQVVFKLKSWETWGDLREWEQAKMAFQKAEHDLKRVLPQRAKLNRETIGALEQRLSVLQQFMLAHQNALEDYHSDVGGVVGSKTKYLTRGCKHRLGFDRLRLTL